MGSSYSATKAALQDKPLAGVTYAQIFEIEAQRIADHLAETHPGTVCAHIGSTAVPGLPAVPTLDIILPTLTPDDVTLHGCGYIRVMYAQLGHPTYALNWSGPGDEPIRALAFVHVCDPSSKFAQRAILVRDVLRSQPRWHSYYSSMRSALLAKCPACYRPCKAQFFEYLWAFHNPGKAQEAAPSRPDSLAPSTEVSL